MVIKLLFNNTAQHNKPHVHVYYGEYEASIGIDVKCWPVRFMKKKLIEHGILL
ncbi:DUF4160 domain-containing protein [Anaeromicropila herbilytica]|nr:DUF4160 domain-containing protein [Anaeromicropila herbilytica]